MVDCIILAGSDPNSELALQEGVSNKALLPIGGKEMICYVLETFRKLKEIERIVVIGPAESLAFLKEKFAVEIVSEGQSMWDNILTANQFLKSNHYVLFSSSDIPLITPEAVEDFLEKCRPYDRDFYYPIISKKNSETYFPGVKRTYLTLCEGIFTGGNILLVNPAKIESSLVLMEDFLKARKRPVKMLSFLGMGFIMRYLTKKLTISQLEARFSHLLNLTAKAVESSHPEIGFDVDKPLDLELTRNVLGKRL
jgi:molybdopterin-guanine dinucleotide biosynthesis protein A